MGPLKHPLQTEADQALMGVDRRRVCGCGVFISRRAKRCRRCRCRAAQARYQRSEKGKAALARYDHSERGRHRDLRYRATPHSKQVKAARNARRIWIGNTYLGPAKTIEQVAVIRQHVKERMREFKQRLSDREKAESVPASAVSTQAAI